MNIRKLLEGVSNRIRATKIASEESNDQDEIGKGTKTKIVAALLVAGFATYVAWWVQEPTNIRADVFESSSTQESSSISETEQIAALSDAIEESGADPEQTEAQVSIIDFAYDPAAVTVQKGMTVVWTNMDAVPHSVTSDTFTSGTLNSDEVFTYTFEEDGTFEYHDSFHPQVKGIVVVGTGVGAEEMKEETEAGSTEQILIDDTEGLYPAALETEDSADLEITEMTAVEDEEAAETDVSAEEAHAAALESERLAKSGPEDILYAFIFLGILYFNRKKLLPRAR